MDNPMTKDDILSDLRSARAEWDELIAQVSEAHLTQIGMAGSWSAKAVRITTIIRCQISECG